MAWWATAVRSMAVVGVVGIAACGGDPPAAAPPLQTSPVAPTVTTTTSSVPTEPTSVGDVLPFTWATKDVPLPVPEGLVPDGSGIATVRFSDGRLLEANIVSCNGVDRWYVFALGTTPDGYSFALSVNNDYALTPRGYADVQIRVVGDPARVDASLDDPYLSGMLPIDGKEPGSAIGPGWLELTVTTIDGQLVSGAKPARDAGRAWSAARSLPPREGWPLEYWQRHEAHLAKEVYPGLTAEGLAVPVESVELLVGACAD